MHAGATLSRRFTLLRPGSYDLPGVDRWVARDERRSVDVHVDLLTSPGPGAVRHGAVRAAQVRDLRFTRVLATGRELLGGERTTYVVSEAPTAVPLIRVLKRRIVPPHVAAAIIGEAAHALQTAAATDLHHGYVRAEVIQVLDSGRVLVAGLGTDGELALQAGLSDTPSEMADAQALARLYLTLVTGIDADDVTVGDLPESLTPRAANMARATIAGDAPTSLAAVGRALSPADSRALRDFSHALTAWPWVPGAEPAPLPPKAKFGLDVSVSAETMHRAQLMAALVLVGGYAAGDVVQVVQTGRTASLIPTPEPAEGVEPKTPGYIPASEEEAARFSARTRRAAARDAQREMGLDTWDMIATEQNRTTPPSVVQAVLEWLHRQWPGSVPLETAAEQARHRARRPAPLRTGPVLVSMFLGLTIVAGIVAFEILTAPMNDGVGQEVEPPSHYPEFTFSPEPDPSASPDADAEGDQAEAED